MDINICGVDVKMNLRISRTPGPGEGVYPVDVMVPGAKIWSRAALMSEPHMLSGRAPITAGGKGGTEMTDAQGLARHMWKVMMALSAALILWIIFMMTRGSEILPTAFRLAGSPQSAAAIERRALDFMNMTMLKPLWEELWVGIIGIFCAVGLRRRRRWAWGLGILWGTMMVTNGLIQGGYEVFILGWPKVCLQTYTFLLPGIVVLVGLLAARREYS